MNVNEKYIKLKTEYIINKILYNKNLIEKSMYDYTSGKLDKLILVETNTK